MLDERDYNEKIIQPAVKKLKERSFADYLDISLILMVIGLFIAIIFTFLVDIIFEPQIDWKDIGVNTVIVSACTIAIYLLLRSYAIRKGRKTKAWIEAEARVKAKGREIIETDNAKHIQEYCREWEQKRLESDIAAVIAPVGISAEDFKEYSKLTKKELKKKYKELTAIQIKTVLKAKRIKRLKFHERYFYVNASNSRVGSPSSGITSRQLNRITNLRIALTTVIISLISASFLREIIIDFSATAVIKCVVKVAIIIFFGAMGMVGGYSFAAVRETSEMNEKSDEIDVFLKWCNGKAEENFIINRENAGD